MSLYPSLEDMEASKMIKVYIISFKCLPYVRVCIGNPMLIAHL